MSDSRSPSLSPEEPGVSGTKVLCGRCLLPVDPSEAVETPWPARHREHRGTYVTHKPDRCVWLLNEKFINAQSGLEAYKLAAETFLRERDESRCEHLDTQAQLAAERCSKQKLEIERAQLVAENYKREEALKDEIKQLRETLTQYSRDSEEWARSLAAAQAERRKWQQSAADGLLLLDKCSQEMSRLEKLIEAMEQKRKTLHEAGKQFGDFAEDRLKGRA